MSIENQIAALVTECQALPDGMDAKGVLPSAILNQLLTSIEPNSSWTAHDTGYRPPANTLLDLCVQRRDGQNIDRAIVRGATVEYPANNMASPVYTVPEYNHVMYLGVDDEPPADARRIAVEVNGWYVTHSGPALVTLPPPIAHTDI